MIVLKENEEGVDLKEKLRQFMTGRYGADQLSRMYLIIAIVFMVLSMFTRWNPFYLAAVVILVYTYYRMFSRNISKMYAQNQKYLNARYKLVAKWQAFKKRFSQRKEYRFFKCPGCKQRVRVPRGKGKISITCPRCKYEFIKKS